MTKPLERVLFTCGGHGGAREPCHRPGPAHGRKRTRRSRFCSWERSRGAGKGSVPQAGYDFQTVHISSFHRSVKPAEIRHNLISLYNLTRSPAEARAILRSFRPDVVVGTGGYASFPMVKAAAKAASPRAVHESNMVPGLTTELLEPYADRIMVGFEACRAHYRHPGIRWWSRGPRCGVTFSK